MKENIIEFTNRFKEKLIGLENTPDSFLDKNPTIILIPGFGVEKREYGMFDDLAETLTDNRFLVYRFDFPGCGESEGNFSKASLSKLKGDLKEIIEFVRNQERVDSSRIGILSQSFGSALTIALGPKVKCLVLMSIGADLFKIFKRFFGQGYNPEGLSSRPRSDGGRTEIGSHFWDDLKKYNLIELIKKITTPVLFIQASQDQFINIEEMEVLFRAANKPKKKLIVEGADHCMQPKREKVYKAATGWFNQWINK